ncbi:Uncharacterized protein APZ42_018649 [Daphnia magna]|uniref:Uncharacterized protein n=1 Tax=Daphnia magna TaxID=35525 RepID=A0A164YPH5_9CRUS|nr:Uncharacterized protein APZ42_018649 [Daphnia magna]
MFICLHWLSNKYLSESQWRKVLDKCTRPRKADYLLINRSHAISVVIYAHERL